MKGTVILDANLLLLLLVGETDRSLIAKHRRLQAYQEVDFDWLRTILRAPCELLLCPNMISDTSNLVRYIYPVAAERVAATLALLLQQSTEKYVQSVLAAEESAYARLGVTDAVLIMLSKTNATLVTEDLDLALAAERIGSDVVNYNYVRAARLGE
ncbi:MAG: hypothetical protein MO852_13075 [Candidatus Devosia euplotis]|nr:hypothetical protein [Candidatus Devosia euplotis]